MDPDKEKRTWYREEIESPRPSKKWWTKEVIYQRKHAPNIPIEEIHDRVITKWRSLPINERLKISGSIKVRPSLKLVCDYLEAYLGVL